MNRSIAVLCGACYLLFFASQVNAIIVTDRWPDDFNTLTGFGQNSDLSLFVVGPEQYGEDNLVPYPSTNGLAVVDNDLGEPVRYFDKIFQLEGETGIWDFDFVVLNSSPYQWSDFHFEIWDSTFTDRVNNIMVSAVLGPTNPWGAVRWGGGEFVEYFDPNHCADPRVCQDPGETYITRLRFDLTTAQTSYDGVFGVRQIATIPEPATIVLLGIGIAAIGWKRGTEKGVRVNLR